MYIIYIYIHMQIEIGTIRSHEPLTLISAGGVSVHSVSCLSSVSLTHLGRGHSRFRIIRDEPRLLCHCERATKPFEADVANHLHEQDDGHLDQQDDDQMFSTLILTIGLLTIGLLNITDGKGHGLAWRIIHHELNRSGPRALRDYALVDGLDGAVVDVAPVLCLPQRRLEPIHLPLAHGRVLLEYIPSDPFRAWRGGERARPVVEAPGKARVHLRA